MQETVAYVYFVQASKSKRIKIGSAIEPKKRLKSLQTGSPEKLKLLTTIEFKSKPQASAMERLFHKKFNNLRTAGEWFECAEELKECLEGLGALTSEYDKLQEEEYQKAIGAEEKSLFAYSLPAILTAMKEAKEVGVSEEFLLMLRTLVENKKQPWMTYLKALWEAKEEYSTKQSLLETFTTYASPEED